MTLCLRCLSPEPDQRPRDAEEVAAAVAALRVAAEERARRAELESVRVAEQGKRRRVLLAAGVAIVVVLLVGLSVSLWQTRRAVQALAAEQQARQDETKARQQAFDALRTMTAEVVERKFAQEDVLTEDDRAFLRIVIAQFDAFAAIKGDDADSRAVRAEGRLRVGTMRYRQLATTHNNRGVLLREMGRLEEAEKDCDQALSKQLAAEFPSRPELRQQVATSHVNRGNLLITTGLLDEAEKDYDQALDIRKQMAADFPDQPDLRNQLAVACVNLAAIHQQRADWAAAKRLLLDGRPHHLAALEVNPSNPAYRQGYRNHLMVLTAAHAGLLEPEDAVRTAETCRDLGWDAPANAYDAACFLSLCVPIVARHDKLDATQREEAAKLYGDAAMKLLHDAASKGFKAVTYMQEDTDLAPLRERDDFRRLVAELEGTPESPPRVPPK